MIGSPDPTVIVTVLDARGPNELLKEPPGCTCEG